MPITGIPATTVDPVASLVTALNTASSALTTAAATYARPATGALGDDYKRNAIYPSFTRTQLLLSQSATGLPSIYWPWVIRVDDKIANPLAKFYMYYSTDHDSTTGGIGMAYANHPLGPWTAHAGAGVNGTYSGAVYTDLSSGAQTETPSVMWNESTSLFHMYYQQAGVSGEPASSQNTMVATSPDGVTWTRVGVAIYHPALVGGSFLHTGYFKPFRVGSQWWGYHLISSGDHAIMARSWSDDGLTWTTDRQLLTSCTDYSGSNTRRLDWHGTTPFMWRGQLWTFGVFSDFTSGGTSGNSSAFVAPLGSDMRSLDGKPITILSTPLSGETVSGIGYGNMVSGGDGNLYGFYISGSKFGSIAVFTGSE